MVDFFSMLFFRVLPQERLRGLRFWCHRGGPVAWEGKTMRVRECTMYDPSATAYLAILLLSSLFFGLFFSS